MRYILFFTITILAATACKNTIKDKKATDSATVVIPPHVINLEEQVKKHPDSIGARMYLIDALDSMGNYKSALAQMDSLISKDSLNFGFWFRKGRLQQNAADTPGAIVSYSRAIRVYAAPEAYLALANLFAETKDKRVFDVCARVDEFRMGREMDSYTAFFTGVYYARTGDTKKALEQFTKSINSNYTLMDAYVEKGSIYYDQKNYAEAERTFVTATTINNTDADAYYWLGKIYEAQGRKQEAIQHYQQALKLDKSITEAAQGLKRLQ